MTAEHPAGAVPMIEEFESTIPTGPRIWAIGGGKGGVGKSVVTANLAVAVARTGARVAVIDADLGGANLHTMVGVPSPKRNLSDFIARRVSSLAEILTPTPIDNLWLVSGAKALLETANPNYGQKGKILNHIARLDVDHVFLDLGAGTAFNVLDFFLVARKGVLVVVPEATSVENAYFFIKAAYFRKLKRAQPRAQVKAAIEEVMKSDARRSVRTPRDLMAQVMAVDPDAGAALMEEASTFSPTVIVNRVERSEQARLGDRDGIGVPRLLRHPTTVSRHPALRQSGSTLGGRAPPRGGPLSPELLRRRDPLHRGGVHRCSDRDRRMSHARYEDWLLLDLAPGAELSEVNQALHYRRGAVPARGSRDLQPARRGRTRSGCWIGSTKPIAASPVTNLPPSAVRSLLRSSKERRHRSTRPDRHPIPAPSREPF